MDKSKFYLNLSKCSEEERKSLLKILQKYRQKCTPGFKENLSPTDIIHFHEGYNSWALSVGIPPLKTELTYPEFIKLFEGGDGETSFKNYIENQRKEFARFVSENYTVDKHLQLRTQIDSLLIAYDQMQNKLNSNQ